MLLADSSVHYYFKSYDIRDGLSQNTVYQILQDRQGFMWYGTKDGLNRFDGMNFKIFNKENSNLKRNFITALYEDKDGNIWIGTDEGVFIYYPESGNIGPFQVRTANGEIIKHYITQIDGDKGRCVYISTELQGQFCYWLDTKKMSKVIDTFNRPNITRFWTTGNKAWLALYADNLYQTTADWKSPLEAYKDADGVEVFKGDIINSHVNGLHNCTYVASAAGLTEINHTTNKTRRILSVYSRALCFNTNMELWVGTEDGLYIVNLITGQHVHLTVPSQDDKYALTDNAIYAIYKDKETGMWIGSFFGGINYYPYQWTHFEKYYPNENLRDMGRRVREICPSNDGTLWIGTEDKGLFNYNPKTSKIVPFKNPLIYNNIHGLCLDGNDLWVGTFSGGLNRIHLPSGRVTHYAKGNQPNQLNANDAFTICRTTSGEIWIGTTSGVLRYNRESDDFTRIPELNDIFTYCIAEDSDGNIWCGTYSNGAYCYKVAQHKWVHYVSNASNRSLSFNKIIGVYEDSSKRLWLMTLGGGMCLYRPQTDDFVRYTMKDGLPSNTVYAMAEDRKGQLWLTTSNGLVCFDPTVGVKHVYTTSNGLLSNLFNFRSAYTDADGKIYLGNMNGLIAFNPETFVENTYQPPIVFTDFYLFNKLMKVGIEESPLKVNINSTDELTLSHDQNSFSIQVAALSFQAPELNKIQYRLEDYDKEWYTVGKNSLISYSNLPYGTYTLHVKASNSDGKWNDAERNMIIKVLPPFYLSSWAYLFYTCIILLTVVGAFLYWRHRTLRKHQRSIEQLEIEKERELYASKIEFFTNVAHEIRTPLTLIKSPLENVIESKNLAEDVREDLEIMHQNTDRLLNLVNQLLDFRKTETEGLKLNFVHTNITELVTTTYKRFLPIARGKQIQIQLNAENDVWGTIDVEAFTKIISNLLNNAVKYSEKIIEVSLITVQSRLKFTVRNDGDVVPLAYREEIFKPFNQYTSVNRTSNVEGTGIGLALARSLAELHQGGLAMDDDLQYNCFVLDIPLDNEETLHHLTSEQVEPVDGAITEKNEEHLPCTILIVEDSREMQTFLVKQLSSNYHVLTANNGVEALQILAEKTVQLIISDIMMPEMDGLEFCRQLKNNLDYSHIPVILLTAKTTIQAKIEGMNIGADNYIEKPFSTEYLKACIANLLRNRAKLQEVLLSSPFVQTTSMAMSKADESFLKKMKDIIDENMPNSDFGPDELAIQLNMSRSSLYRKIKGLLDMTPNDYIRLERLKKAALLLKEGECKINEVCYMTGFNSPSYFTKCFQKQFGVLPKDFVK